MSKRTDKNEIMEDDKKKEVIKEIRKYKSKAFACR